jgi:hypothetical protein
LVITEAGVAMDPAKVQAVHDWPQPCSARTVRGFLGLAGYYCKSVHDYGSIAAPLTALLKKEGFSWNDAAAAAFQALKAETICRSYTICDWHTFVDLFFLQLSFSTQYELIAAIG